MNDLGSPHNGHPAGDFSVAADEVTCQQFVELITDYFEGVLTPRSLSHVEEHLVMCDWCRTYEEQMQATITMLGETKEDYSGEPPEAVLAVLRAKQGTGQ